MNTLSRREEDTLLKSAKARAMKECDPIVIRVLHLTDTFFSTSEFADCATGRVFSVAWKCRDKYRAVQDCMVQ
ncbi:hypothetical protein B0H21DRAFT_693061 [Amylocystis lapponica]|nr:hypothetical protein B0H21DRAFT_693061 [Amylocystis lapponica]